MMKSTLNSVLIFATGAAIGSVVTWRILKKKYEQLAREEIESYREIVANRTHKYEGPEQSEKVDDISTDEDVYGEVLKHSGYNDNPDIKTKKGAAKKYMNNTPHVIPPDEFGELDDYETVSLTYYADEILTDESDNVIDDVDDLVGLDSLGHFGEYEDDSVFVRNDNTKCDYEILLDTRRYSDVIRARG